MSSPFLRLYFSNKWLQQSRRLLGLILNRLLRQSLLMRTVLIFTLIMFTIMLSIYHLLIDNPMARNYDIALNTDESWFVPTCNIFNGRESIMLGSLDPCAEFNNKSSSLKLFVSVHSTPGELKSRNNLRKLFRETVAIAKTMGVEMIIKQVFVVGLTQRSKLAHIEKEHVTHGDMLIGKFVDSYRNLTLKMMFGMLYANEYCRTADYVLKIDDDMFYMPSRLINVLLESSKTHLYIGMSNPNRFPRRNPNNKFYISPSIYPKSLFPPFVFGGATIFSMDSVQHINSSHLSVPCLPLEDTYMGLLMNNYAKVTRTSMWSRTDSMNRPLTDCELSSTLFVESRKYQKFYVTYKSRLVRPDYCQLLTRSLQHIN